MLRNTWMDARIIYIERRRSDSPSFIPGLRKKGYVVEGLSSGIEAIERMRDFHPDVVIINAASLRTNGKRICKSIHELYAHIPIIIILDQDQSIGNLDDPTSLVIRLPFTVRKLANRIILFLKGDPEKIIKAGPIELDVEHRTLRCNNKETRLTPRLSDLLQVLINNNGKVVPRDELFTKIWKTQYTGDTRTLDVHISWLRELIESNPRAPQLLRTVRGVGYRLIL
jgi:DNA-binding response OmpR family regulator